MKKKAPHLRLVKHELYAYPPIKRPGHMSPGWKVHFNGIFLSNERTKAAARALMKTLREALKRGPTAPRDKAIERTVKRLVAEATEALIQKEYNWKQQLETARQNQRAEIAHVGRVPQDATTTHIAFEGSPAKYLLAVAMSYHAERDALKKELEIIHLKLKAFQDRILAGPSSLDEDDTDEHPNVEA